MQPDLTYYHDGMFTAFLPETPQGETAWRQLADQTDGTGKVFRAQTPATLEQLRAAGYAVRMRKPRKVKPGDIDALLAELTA